MKRHYVYATLESCIYANQVSSLYSTIDIYTILLTLMFKDARQEDYCLFLWNLQNDRIKDDFDSIFKKLQIRLLMLCIGNQLSVKKLDWREYELTLTNSQHNIAIKIIYSFEQILSTKVI